jgi:lysophospholipase L1-like esterase
MSKFNLTAYNLGIRRETTVDVATRLQAEARPRLKDGDVFGIVLSSGVNDTMMDDGRQQQLQFVDTLTALRSSLEFCTSVNWPVLVIGPPPLADEQHNLRIKQLSNEMATLCRETGHVFVDTFAQLVGDAVWRAEVAADDGAHPNAAGYARLADMVWPAFQCWLSELMTAVTLGRKPI